MILGGALILLTAKARGIPLGIPKGELAPLLVVAGVNVTGWNLLSAYGVILLQAGRAAILAYTMPLWAAVLGRLVLGERLTATRLAGLTLGLCGLAVLMGEEVSAMGRAPGGALLMLGAALSWALGTVLIKRRNWHMGIEVFAGWQLILGGVPVLVGTVLLEPPFWCTGISLGGSLAVGYVILMGVVLGYWGWMKVVDIFPVTIASLGTLAVPAIGVLSSGIILGEPVGWRELFSLGLVSLGIAGVVLDPGHGALRERRDLSS